MTTPITEERIPRLRKAFTATVVAPRTIRAKLIRILAVALVILLALLGLSAARQLGDYENASTTAADAHLSDALQGFIHEHQKERGLTTGYVGGRARRSPGCRPGEGRPPPWVSVAGAADRRISGSPAG
ncbi:hypothetical protein ACO0M4_36435 [Streptomyces sp. RGM 3693]|uniref:hypothetical protein n=1 Tax=Streptomyces sp. RGM 3693 TaxID=3413284 RepID=UPI003D2891DE